MEWQPIGTAPRDGTRILVYSNKLKMPLIVRWGVSECASLGDETTGWVTDAWGPGYDYSCDEGDVITHWAPIPPPPAAPDTGAISPALPSSPNPEAL